MRFFGPFFARLSFSLLIFYRDNLGRAQTTVIAAWPCWEWRRLAISFFGALAKFAPGTVFVMQHTSDRNPEVSKTETSATHAPPAAFTAFRMDS